MPRKVDESKHGSSSRKIHKVKAKLRLSLPSSVRLEISPFQAQYFIDIALESSLWNKHLPMKGHLIAWKGGGDSYSFYFQISDMTR